LARIDLCPTWQIESYRQDSSYDMTVRDSRPCTHQALLERMVSYHHKQDSVAYRREHPSAFPMMHEVYQNDTQTLRQDAAKDDSATDSYYVTALSR